MNSIKRILFCSILSLTFFCKSFGSHLYGGELYYTHISGNTYTVTMVLYGDCGGTPSVFAELYTATPEVQVYNGTSLYRTVFLKVLPGAGTEVTPVCAGSVGSTTCNGGTVPGVRRFAYADTITLNTTSSAWKFHSTGYLSALSQAGRSNSITNISIPGASGSVMSLDATLNNILLPNSNPTFTTIPTPFFCINVAQEYNPGAVDPNLNDSLSYSLVDGIEPSGSTVSYFSGYSASSPIGYATGTFSFNVYSGQLTFTPNLTQKSLVVCKVSEYRGGILVGTSVREMTFIVLSTCSNRSPYGKISDVSGGTAAGNTTVNICKDEPFLTFNINPVDSDGNAISVSVKGLPAGASLAISGSGTTKPTTTFSWNTGGVAGGSYYFFVTYQDDGCPLSSKQTVAYTINITKPTATFKILTKPTCVRKAYVEIKPTGGVSPWTLKVFSDSTLLHTFSSTGLVLYDSLSPGTYRFGLTDSTGCYGESFFTVSPPVLPSFQTITSDSTTCYGSATGSVSVSAKDGLPPYEFSIDGGSFGSSGAFPGVFGGTHIIRIRDANNCIKDTAFVVKEIDSLQLKNKSDKPLCKPYRDGSLKVEASGGLGPYLYAFNDTGSYVSASFYDSLSSGWYNIMVKDANGCEKKFSIYVEDSIVVRSAIVHSDVSCSGGNDGSFTVIPYIGKLPFIFSFDSGAYTSTTVYNSLKAKNYIFWIKDGNGCILDTFVNIREPEKLSIEFLFTPPKCFDGNDGMIKVKGVGGTAFYIFAIDGGALDNTDVYIDLKAGDHKFSIKDKNGCIHDTIVTLLQPDRLNANPTIIRPLCNGDENGIISLNGLGGTSPYLYTVNGGFPGKTNIFSGLKAGVYTVLISDSNGCKADTELVLTQPAKIQGDNYNITHPTCEGYADGAIEMFPKGGTSPFQYSIDGIHFSSNNPILNLKEGTYTVMLQDTNNCIGEVAVTLIGYPKIILDGTNVTIPSCFGLSDGILELFATGGNPPLTYMLQPSNTTISNAVFKNLKSGVFVVTVVDNTNCRKDFSKLVLEPEQLEIKAKLTQNDCTGPDNGKIEANVTGGTKPYNYRWNLDGKSDSMITNLAVGKYILTVQDAQNCTTTLDTDIVYENCCKPGIPNAFSPNNDGRNDQLRILSEGGVSLKEFSIYNRYGQQVFTTTDINQAWDGKFNNKEEGMGVYYYFIRMICGNEKNKEVTFKGDITLIR